MRVLVNALDLCSQTETFSMRIKYTFGQLDYRNFVQNKRNDVSGIKWQLKCVEHTHMPWRIFFVGSLSFPINKIDVHTTFNNENENTPQGRVATVTLLKRKKKHQYWTRKFYAIFHYDSFGPLCVLEMTLFNMFGVRSKHKWLLVMVVFLLSLSSSQRQSQCPLLTSQDKHIWSVCVCVLFLLSFVRCEWWKWLTSHTNRNGTNQWRRKKTRRNRFKVQHLGVYMRVPLIFVYRRLDGDIA